MSVTKNFTLALLGTATLFSSSCAKQDTDNPVEVGNVKWGRNLDAAKTASTVSDKPILLLFQEVPG